MSNAVSKYITEATVGKLISWTSVKFPGNSENVFSSSKNWPWHIKSFEKNVHRT